MDDELLLKALILKTLLDDDDTVKTLLDVGLRVVRGPDWKWDNKDGGEGYVGTVVEIGKSGTSSQNTVIVQWDCGTRDTYRIGANGSFDLRVLDNAPIGVKHPTINCDSCRKKGILGIRWKCKQCYDYDLCNQCYMSGRHDITHPFLRFQTYDSSSKVDVPKRQGAVKIQMKGIFASAKVVRGHNWEWGAQDGGEGKTGIVLDIYSWDDDKTDRDACHVTWSATDKSNSYRIGNKGKVDLKCIEAAADGFYYRDHLPVLGDEKRTIRVEDSVNTKVKNAENQKDVGTAEKKTDDNKRTISKTGSAKGLDFLSLNLKDLFYSGQFSDLTIKVQARTFKVHKAVLSARSPMFASKLQNGINMLEISDCEPDTFEDVLYYMYTGKLKQVFYRALYDAAVKYDVHALKDEYVRFKKDCVSWDYISDFLAAG